MSQFSHPQWVPVPFLALGWSMNPCLCTSTSFIYFRYLLPIPSPLVQSAHSMDMYICTVTHKGGNIEMRYELHFLCSYWFIVFGKINCLSVGKSIGFNVKIICICPFSITLNLLKLHYLRKLASYCLYFHEQFSRSFHIWELHKWKANRPTLEVKWANLKLIYELH